MNLWKRTSLWIDFPTIIWAKSSEAKVEQLPYGGKRSYTCPKGTIVNAFSNNPIYKQPVGKWKDKASTRIQKLLEELRLQLEL